MQAMAWLGARPPSVAISRKPRENTPTPNHRLQAGFYLKGTTTILNMFSQDATCSGNSFPSPAAVAAQTPRSVINPVTSRAGVTSKAGFAAALPSGSNEIVATVPFARRPDSCETSCALRSSMGISFNPSRSVQSMLGDGAAT